MKRIFLAAMMAVGGAGPLTGQGHPHVHVTKESTSDHRDHPEVHAVVEGFARALQAGDSTRALSFLHPDVVIYEGGHAETLTQYRSHHLAADIAFLRAVKQETTAHQMTVQGDVALALSETRSKGRFRERDIDSRGAETLILVRSSEGWKIRHIHWSSGR